MRFEVRAAVLLSVALASPLAFACQENCVVNQVRNIRGRVSWEDKSKKIVGKMILRSAAKDAVGRNVATCHRPKGDVLREIELERNGKFDFGDLKDGEYWLSFYTAEYGRTWFVEVNKKEISNAEAKDFHIVPDSPPAGCYSYDIEHNVTHPEGWSVPIPFDDETVTKTNNAQTR